MKDNRPFRLILTGGETGGHLYPAVAVAEALAETVPGAESVYVGAAGRIDMQKTIGEHIMIHALDMPPYHRGGLLGNALLPYKFFSSFLQAFHLLRQYRPHVVMGVGAFPSVPVVLAAWVWRTPTLLLEPNVQPGMANSFLAKAAKRICVSHQGMADFFPEKKLVITGTPVRGSLLPDASDRQRGREFFSIPDGAGTILITGGSTGSSTINSMVLDNLALLTHNAGHLLWQTGEKDEARIRRTLGNQVPQNCTLMPYMERMGCAYAAADLVVSSAGAVSLSELALLGKPAVIIPDPEVTENHQLKNAQDLHAKKACLLAGEDLSSHHIATLIIELLNDHSKLEQFKDNILKCAEPRAARLIVDQILRLAGWKS